MKNKSFQRVGCIGFFGGARATPLDYLMEREVPETEPRSPGCGVSGQRADPPVPLGDDRAGGGDSSHPAPTTSCQPNAIKYGTVWASTFKHDPTFSGERVNACASKIKLCYENILQPFCPLCPVPTAPSR